MQIERLMNVTRESYDVLQSQYFEVGAERQWKLKKEEGI